MLNQPVHRILRCDKGAGDAGRARAAIGLQHITVQVDGAFAQFFQIKHRTHRATNQALNFLGASALLAASGLAVTPRVGGTGQHAVLGRDPTLATALLMRGHLLFDRGRAQHLGGAKLDQNRAFSVHCKASGDTYSAQMVWGAAVRARAVRRL